MTKQKASYFKKLLYGSTGAFVILSVLTLTLWDKPQCPDGYTQAQINTSGCVAGANIGAGFLTVFVLAPLAFFVLLLWVLAITRIYKAQPQKKD